MVSTVITSLLGYVYWIVVARTLGSAVSGSGAATTSALMAVTMIAGVGAAAAMLEWLPKSRSDVEWRRQLTVGLVVAAIAGLAVGAGAAVLLGEMTHTLPELRAAGTMAVFAVGSAVFAVATVLDYAAVAMHRSRLFLVRNTLFVLLRIPVLFAPMLVWGRPDAVLLSWVASAAVSVLVAAARFHHYTGHRLRLAFGHLRADLAAMARSMAGQHVITIASMLAAYLLPVIVIARLDATSAMYFYSAWMLCAVFFMISPAISTALFAEVAGHATEVVPLTRRAAALMAVLLLPPMVVYLLGGRLLLDIFGHGYAAHGYVLLLILTASAIPDAVTNVAVAILRGTGRIASAAWLNIGMLAMCLLLSWLLLPRWGVAAVGIAWLVAQGAGSVWVLAAWRGYIRVVSPSTRRAGAHRSPVTP